MKPTLELSMIVKNGAAGLARCLGSVKGLADRITIGDTGSADETIEIAGKFGANVISLEWNSDFAAARNAVLAQSQCDWILILDADEMLDCTARSQIPELMLNPSISCYDVYAWNYVLDPGFRSSGEQAIRNPVLAPETSSYPAYFPSLNTRLFRRSPDIYFEHCVHETVADRVDALRLGRKTADFVIHHFGYVEDDEQKRKQKEKLYYDLAMRKVAGSRDNYQANLGAGIAELDHAKNPTAALSYFEKALAIHARRAAPWLYAGICLLRTGKTTVALTHLNRARAIEPKNILAASSLGDLFFQLGDHVQARESYELAIALGDLSALSLAKLGAAEVHLGLREAGIARVESAVLQSPENGELYDILATARFLAGDQIAACEAADRRLSLKNASAFNYFLAATLHLHTNMRLKAEAILKRGSRLFPEDAEIKGMMASLNI